MRKKIRFTTETAVMLALLVAVQGVTAGLGNQFVTGSCVNLVLAVSAMMIGLWGGSAVAVISPFLASVFGIGPKFIQLLPAIALGNFVFVLVLALFCGKQRPAWQQAAAWICSAAAKAAALYVVLVKILVPALVSGGVIPEKAAGVLSAQFSWPQLVTALIGGALAMVIVPILKKALHRN